MATSGAFTTNPDIADLLREAYERIGIPPSRINFEHVDAGVRSANYALNHLGNQGMKAYELVLVSQALTSGLASYSLGTGARIFTAALRRDGVDTPMLQIAREDYEHIPNKAQTGRPTELFLDAATYNISPRTYYLWQVPDRSTDTLRMWVLRRPESITTLAQESPISFEWQDAFCDELAKRLARKYAPDRLAEATAAAGESFRLARENDRDRASVRLRMSTRGRRGWR